MSDVRSRISVVVADITTLDVDAIVNAANSSLLGGGGVDGAIHRAAGPDLLHACRLIGGCPTGEARLTDGFRLPARHIIHTVGPVWRGDAAAAATPIGEDPADDLLMRCYVSSMTIAATLSLKTVAFPSISTGIYGFPKDRAAQIAVQSVLGFLSASASPASVTLCAFSESDADILRAALDAAALNGTALNGSGSDGSGSDS